MLRLLYPRKTMPSDAFMMDVENEILRAYGDEPEGLLPYHLAIKGVARLENAKWMNHVAKCIKNWYGEGRGADLSLDNYIVWVRGGGGDDWFQSDYKAEDDPLFMALCHGHITVQCKKLS